MTLPLDKIDQRLLGEWQRNFPLVRNPFAQIGARLGLSEAEVLNHLVCLSEIGAISRVGATIRPNTVGASTLAAVAAPEWRIDDVADMISAEPGVNHSYLRENDWNVWFVATGPDSAHVAATLKRIEAATGLAVLDLPLVRPYHIDLGFPLDGGRLEHDASGTVDMAALRSGDRDLLQALTRGLAVVPRPFTALAEELGRPETDVIERIRALSAAGIVARMGIILRHRALGWRSNAMVVWRLPDEDVDRAGRALAVSNGVTLCYRRRPDERHWPFNLYCMIHARSRAEALDVLSRATEKAGITELPKRVLFSLRCFKQAGALVQDEQGAAA